MGRAAEQAHPHGVVVAELLALQVDDCAGPVRRQVHRHDDAVAVQHRGARLARQLQLGSIRPALHVGVIICSRIPASKRQVLQPQGQAIKSVCISGLAHGWQG